MRHSFVSSLSDSGVPIEDISRLVGHRNMVVTETVYRKQIRPVLVQGTEAMDGSRSGATSSACAWTDPACRGWSTSAGRRFSSSGIQARQSPAANDAEVIVSNEPMVHDSEATAGLRPYPYSRLSL
ncbi:hypothetical protein [Streptosporangium sp. NPDC000396]|uniref:hypothetical protein n=1 Tax=Streptosporangium sp. NPDC000396 TaxID=3366185 RepID=UPI00369A4302